MENLSALLLITLKMFSISWHTLLNHVAIIILTLDYYFLTRFPLRY